MCQANTIGLQVLSYSLKESGYNKPGYAISPAADRHGFRKLNIPDPGDFHFKKAVFKRIEQGLAATSIVIEQIPYRFGGDSMAQSHLF